MTEPETVFGRPASWLAALPAVVVGCSAFCLAVYGTWFMPPRLQPQYAAALDAAHEEYAEQARPSLQGVSWAVGDAAGQVDVIYGRLVDLEGGPAERYWQWAAFLQAHADFVERQIHDPAASLPADLRQRLQEQAQLFERKADEITEQLASGTSPLRAAAVVRMAHTRYQRGLEQFAIGNLSTLINDLRQVLEGYPPASRKEESNVGDRRARALPLQESGNEDRYPPASREGRAVSPGRAQEDPNPHKSSNEEESNGGDRRARALPLQESGNEDRYPPASREGRAVSPGRAQESGYDRERAELLLVELLLEAAWQSDSTSRLRLDEQALQVAWETYEAYQPAAGEQRGEPLRWESLGQLLRAMRGRELAAEGSTPVPPHRGGNAEASDGWQVELAELQLAALDADWTQVSYLLSRNAGQRPPMVNTHVARTICRLACSPHARDDKSWAERAEVGVMLALSLAPQLAEASELLWECARQQAGQVDAAVKLSPRVPEVLAQGQHAVLKHSVAALAASMTGQAAVARTHLELIRRSQGSATLLARVALWRIQTLSASQPASPSGRPLPPDRQQVEPLIELLTAASQLEPDNGVVWFALGSLHYHLGDRAATQSALQRAEQLLGDIPVIRHMLQ